MNTITQLKYALDTLNIQYIHVQQPEPSIRFLEDDIAVYYDEVILVESGLSAIPYTTNYYFMEDQFLTQSVELLN